MQIFTRFLMLAAVLVFTLTANAQRRYLDPVFNEVEVSNFTPLASNYTVLQWIATQGQGHAIRQPLVAQFYKPKGDTKTDRPLVIYIHTGNFFPYPANGSCGGTMRDSSNVEIATRLAKMGYVVAVINYRQGWNPFDPNELIRRYFLINAAYRGVQDMSTYVRYFRRSVDQLGNPHGIDPEKITLWGQGTGGYLSLAAAYLNSYPEIFGTADPNKFKLPTANGYIPMVFEKYNGNIEGTGALQVGEIATVDATYNAISRLPLGDTLCIPNHVGFSSEFALCVNMGGALGDSTWMNKGEVPLISYHVPTDAFAPCETNVLNVPTPIGPQPVVEVTGSCGLARKADGYGNNDVFKTIPEGYDPYGKLNKSGFLGYYQFDNTPDDTSSPWEWSAGDNPPSTCNKDADLAKRYIDTIMGYFAPRACVALGLGCNFKNITSVGLIGSATANGWGSDTPMTQVDDCNWTLDVTLTAAEVKFRANGAWDINWGASDFPTGTGVQNGPNIPVFAGDYTVKFNACTGEYSFAVKSDIGIIGSATPGGWSDDTNMYAADSVNYFININLTQGDVKFRANDSWDINWGDSAFPEGVGTQGGPNIPIAVAGKYRVDFNKATGAYKFSEVVDYSSIAVIGSATAGGWDTETPLAKDAGNPDLWRGVVTLTEGELKFRANNGWAINWGGGEFPTDTASLNGANIVVPADKAGDYQVTFNTKTLVYKFLIIGNYGSIGIIGDATPGGWDTDTDLTQDATDKSIWRGRMDLVNGEAKFRADNDWAVNWGGDTFPEGTGVQDGPNIPVTAGDYKITFNSTTGDYKFEAVVEYDKISLVGKSGPFGDWPGADDSRDTYLDKDPNDPNHWTLASVTLTDHGGASDGGVKFRAEAAWAINWGAADFPVGTGTQDGPNIKTVAGTYKVDFRSDTGDYAFTEPSSTYDLLSSDVITIFPNPAKDVLNITVNTDALKGEVKATLYGLKGEMIQVQTLNINGTAKMNVSGLQPGNYILQLSNATNFAGKSVVILK